jgi:hypothetical protein
MLIEIALARCSGRTGENSCRWAQVVARILIHYDVVIVDRSGLSVVGVLKMAASHHHLRRGEVAISNVKLRLVE